MRLGCRKCHADLETWNNGRFLWIKYCPQCGARLLKKQSEALHVETTIEEISDMIRGHLLDVLKNGDSGRVSADALAQLAWETESYNGVVFCANYEADRFVARHVWWVDEALAYVCDTFGESERYVRMKAECNDRFLVPAFMYATEHYVFNQLEIGCDEGDLSKKRMREIVSLIKRIEYDGVW